MASRYLSPGVRAALTAFSTRTCYFPGCNAPLLDMVDGQYRMSLEIAHIRALHEDGVRFDPTMSDKQRNDFPNLVYLCTKHHRAVDADEGKYTVSTLIEWKESAESGHPKFTSGDRPVTEERLESVITEALRDRDRDITDTLERLQATDAEAAALMQELLDELRDARKAGSVVDPDAAAMLHVASRRLQDLSLMDAAKRLNNATENLSDLDAVANTLNRAAKNFNSVKEFM